MPRSSAKRSYRRRIKTSNCRGLKLKKCNKNKTCKYAQGKKRSFCRKLINTQRVRNSASSSGSTRTSQLKTLTPL